MPGIDLEQVLHAAEVGRLLDSRRGWHRGYLAMVIPAEVCAGADQEFTAKRRHNRGGKMEKDVRWAGGSDMTWLLVGKPGEAAEMTPIGAVGVSTIGKDEMLKSLSNQSRGKVAVLSIMNQAEPTLEIAGTGFDDGRRGQAVTPEVVNCQVVKIIKQDDTVG